MLHENKESRQKDLIDGLKDGRQLIKVENEAKIKSALVNLDTLRTKREA